MAILMKDAIAKHDFLSLLLRRAILHDTKIALGFLNSGQTAKLYFLVNKFSL